MNILSLRYFLKIAEHGSITRAAAELHITQPALTRHVAHLEDHLRVKLLMRHGRGVRLTEPGRLLTTRAQAILADIDILSEELLARQTEPQGELSVGLPWSWSEGITAPVVKQFNELYPDVRLKVIADSSETLEGMLKSQYLDFAVLTMVEDDPEIDSSPVANDAAFLFGPKGCGLAELNEISMADLAEQPTIRQYNATVVAKRTDQRLAKLGRSQNVVIKTSASMMLELSELGLGYVVMTGCAMGSKRYELEAVAIADLSVTWTISTLRMHPKTAAVNAFEALLRQAIRARVDAGGWPGVTLIEGAV
ncbi:LysR family transcriptional regulator [Flavisphingomonas formosensis]|uniref:LysR family transcriptional regulator n=1 Tax=Flavisphingomonas formosensis TaxID=861534 RepID=UPI0012FB755F|nr:LysR family transcriptional regulator [Sphingomonas formosensis]